MAETRISDTFNLNCFFWKVFGLWPGKQSSIYYKYYSIPFLFVTLIMYIILLTVNLIYTPRTVELLIREVIFYFTEIAVTSKVLMILFKRKQIFESFDLLDCEAFKGNDEISKNCVEKSIKKYRTLYKLYTILCHLSFVAQIVVPVLSFWLVGSDLLLPVCNYYFLSDEIRNSYFTYIYIYQSVGIYAHMMYNVNIDSFMPGLIFLAITQLKIVNHKIKLKASESQKTTLIQDKMLMAQLIETLKSYHLILRYCYIVQDIINATMFVQFGMSSLNICTVLVGLTLPSSKETLVFLIGYLFAVTLEIFVPAWLGTSLTLENQNLAFAAYNSDWIPQSEKFKRSLRLFVTRANKPIILHGMKIFPLSLITFSSILKTAYSFFTLVRNIQDHQNQM